jgi:hypothetical protein
LFNVYLDYCVDNIEELKEATALGIILAFADDMLARCKTLAQAKRIIAGMNKLK